MEILIRLLFSIPGMLIIFGLNVAAYRIGGECLAQAAYFGTGASIVAVWVPWVLFDL